MDRTPEREEAPPSATPLFTPGPPNPLFLAALATLLLAGTVALAHRVLLLLSGFLATTLLLLRVTLAGILTLLTQILVLLLRHSGKLPCWTSEERQRPAFALVAPEPDSSQLRNPDAK